MRHQSLAFALALLAIGTVGCGLGGGSGKKSDASVASTDSSSTAVVTSGNGTIAGPQTTKPASPVLASATFRDKDGSGTVTEGDEIELQFDSPMASVASYIDPANELELPVKGDTFGKGASISTSKIDPRLVVVKLGTDPKLRVNGEYDEASTSAGSPSAVRVSPKGTGALSAAVGKIPADPGKNVDLTGVAYGAFKPTQSMYYARGLHSATLLDDGRVLVVGGRGRNEFIQECELFDPVANTWSRVDMQTGDKGFMKHGSFNVKRTMFATCKLKDGRVLILGGYGAKEKSWFGLGGDKMDVIDCAHIFDPKANTFSEIGHMKHPRRSHQATLMADGRVLISGGYDEGWFSLKKTLPDAEIYDPATNKFSDSAPMVEKRMYHTATALDGGRKIAVVGGEKWDGTGFLGTGLFAKSPKLLPAIAGDVFETNKFTRSADLVFDRRNHAAVEVANGDVIVAGGDDGHQSLTQIERLDRATLKFNKAGDLKTSRTNPAMVRTGREVLIGGGLTFSGKGGKELADVEVYDEKLGQVVATIKMTESRNSTQMVVLKDGRVLLIGGLTAGVKDLLSLDGHSLQSCEILERP